MNDIPLHSSVLAGLRYDPEHQQLWLRFQTAEIYVYRMVPAAVVQALIKSPSHGRYFNSAIRGHFEYHRLSLALMGGGPARAVRKKSIYSGIRRG